MKKNRIISLFLSFIMTLSVVGTVPATVYAAYDREQYYLDSIAEYSQFPENDPQYITDEQLFGVWDNEAGEWSTLPIFYYEEFPEMGAIEEAAKLGNYEQCKADMLEYYREKHDGYFINGEGGGSLSAQERAQDEAPFDNFMRLDYTVIGGKAHFSDKFTWQSVDVRQVLSGIATNSTADKKLQFLLAAGKKDGYRIEIDNDKNKPYVTALINGEERTFPLTTAVYTDGTEPDTPHYGMEKLLVEESQSSIGSPTTVDENTKNTLLQFNVPGIRSTDTISSATLHLNGRFVEDDIDDEPRLGKIDYKSLYVIRWTGSTAIDRGLTYNKFVGLTTHYRSYDGEPAFRFTEPDASNSYLTSATALRDPASFCANGYHTTGEEAFAYHAIRLFVQDIIQRGNYEKLMADYSAGKYVALGLAGYGFGAVWILDKLMDSKYMTPEAFTIIMKHNWMMGKWGAENWPKHFEGVNHGAYGVQGLEDICFLYPEFRDVHGPLKTNEDGSLYYMDETLSGSVTGGWLATANHRRGIKAMTDIKEDGASIEGSISYALEGMGGYLSALDAGEKLGIDNSYAYEDAVEANAKIEQGLMYVISKLNPMLGDFQVGDGGAWTTHYGNNLQKYTKIIDNPYLDYVVSDRKEGKEPPFLTMAYDSRATAVFRNAWVDDYSIAAHFEVRGGGSHNHNDDGNIVLCAYGNYLLVDPRQGDYNEEDPNERWVSSTRGHNTVEINNTVRRGYRSYINQFEPMVFEYDEDGNPKVDENGVAMVDDPLIVPISQLDYYPGDLHPDDREINTVYDYIRSNSYTYTNHNKLKEDFNVERDVLFLRDGYFVVVDNLSPEFGERNGSNHYKQLWHFLPDANISVDKENNVIRTNFNGRADLIVATVKNNDNMTAQYKYGLYAGERSVFGTVKYGTFEQDKLGTATFNTLLYPVRANDDAEVTTKKLLLDLEDHEANAFTATVVDKQSRKEKDIYFYTLFDKEKKAPMTFGAYETDGTLALGDKVEDDYKNAVLRQGSYLENIIDDEYVIYSEEEVEDVGVYWQNDEIDIAYNTEDEYNNEIDLTKLTVKANGTAKTVRLNGEEIEFEQKGRYIYFGEEPILDDEDILPAPDDDENEESSGSGSSGSHGSAGSGSSGGSRPSGGSSGGSSSGGSSSGGNKPESTPTEPKKSETYSKELDKHWAKKEISELVDNDVVEGFGDGTLGLDRKITRAQFITMLVRALKTEVKEYKESFSDVSKDSWYADYMETAAANGWIQGDGKNSYPDRNITREEITKILVAAFEQKYGEINLEKGNEFTDGESISVWAEESVNKAVEAGLINGMGNGEFQPKESAKREQAMVLIHRLINNKQ